MLRRSGKSLQSVGFEADTRPMSRRLALAVFALLLAAPATAAADERDNARALADIGVRASGQIEAIIASHGKLEAPKCKTSARLARRGTRRQINAAASLLEGYWIAGFARATEPVVAAAVADMQAVPTADPALRAGRTAWRRVDSAYRRFGALPPAHYCSVLRDYVRGDFHLTRAMRAAIRMDHRANAWDTTDIDARLAAAVKRLVELGVPAADAGAFDGDVS
jgi:hypothetical protein